MTVIAGELPGVMPALLDALGQLGKGVLVFADRGRGFERWYANGPAAAILGYTLDEFLQIPLIEVVAPEQRPLVAQLSAGFRDGQPIPPALELVGLHKDGSHLTVELAIGHQLIPEGLVYVAVIRDPDDLRLID